MSRAQNELQAVVPVEENAPTTEIVDGAVDFGYSIQVNKTHFVFAHGKLLHLVFNCQFTNVGSEESYGGILNLSETCKNTRRSPTKIISVLEYTASS